jgi:hypothetical protein
MVPLEALLRCWRREHDQRPVGHAWSLASVDWSFGAGSLGFGRLDCEPLVSAEARTGFAPATIKQSAGFMVGVLASCELRAASLKNDKSTALVSLTDCHERLYPLCTLLACSPVSTVAVEYVVVQRLVLGGGESGSDSKGEVMGAGWGTISS